MDSRFSRVHTDPRFKRKKKDSSKVTIDSRFKQVLDDSSEFGSKVSVDKYGRKKVQDNASELKRYYRINQDSQESEEDNLPATGFNSEEQLENMEGVDFARGNGLVSSSEEEDEPELLVEKTNENRENGKGGEASDLTPFTEENIPRGDETRRFAVVNLDWDNVKVRIQLEQFKDKSSDLFKLFDGFCPKDSRIVSVQVFPSEFGKERMKQETVQGPPSEIFNKDLQQEFDHAQLRKYQLERLKYYYAVVECDSVSAAKVIYDACDGAEFETSSNFMDLRYIPDEMSFTEEPRDEALQVPHVYNTKSFVTRALQHTKVELTWDNDDPERTKITKKKFNKDELEKMDMSAYIASSSSEDEDTRQRYRHILLSGGDQEEEQGDLEVTFMPGLSEIAEKLVERKLKGESESVFEQNRRKIKEKRKEKLNATKQTDDDDALISEDDALISQDDEFFESDVDEAYMSDRHDLKGENDQLAGELESSESEEERNRNKKSLVKAEKREKKLFAEKEKQELELLLIPSQNGLKHFDAKEILKRKRKADAEGLQDDFSIDLMDTRFKPVFESHHFAIDPTHPAYKKTSAMETILLEKRRKNANNQSESIEEQEAQAQTQAQVQALPLEQLQVQHQNLQNKTRLDTLVNAVKSKTKRAFKTKNQKSWAS